MLYDESLSSITINNQQPSAVSALKKSYIIYANKTTQYICGCAWNGRQARSRLW